MKPETLFRKKVVAFLDTLDNCWHESIQQQTIRGTPDIICCIRGYFVGLEIKATRVAKLSPMQHHKLRKIFLADGYAFRVDPSNLEEIKSILINLNDGGLAYDYTNVCPLNQPKILANIQ